MKVEINIRGNGACPMCQKRFICPIQKRINNALAELKSERKDPFEMVVYTCPSFKEE
ncbi:MAG: hypothetical protein JXR70_09750 [Spirochaetales bacterium]|nr:hypothetical protein [Spirochaetales bacterium]